MSSYRSAAKRFVFAAYKQFVRCGVHVLPVHYATPVPDILELQRTKEAWARKSELPGVSVDLERQADNLRRICAPFGAEYAGNRTYQEGVSNHFGPGYGYIEAQALHAVVRHYKPSRIVEVGSGVSTYCMLKACEANDHETGRRSEITSIEPYPSPALERLTSVHLMTRKVQTVPMSLFTALTRGDLLFIDSSHTVKAGGDVNHLVLEVLPRLRPGVIVHLHDIYLPYDYQRNLLRTMYHWSETSLLRAFLISNNAAEILFCLSHLHYEGRDALREVFPEYQPQDDSDGLQLEHHRAFEDVPGHFPSSIYIEVQG